MRSQLKIIITKIINHIWSLNQKMDNEKNATQEDESWGEYTKIDKDNKPVSKEQREKEKRHWNKKNIEECFVPSGIGRRRRTIIIMLGT